MIASYLFLGGAAGGAFLVGGLLDLQGKNSKLSKWGGYVGALAIVVGLGFLLLDLGHPERAFLAFVNVGSSVMTWGTWIISAFAVVAVAYISFYFGMFPWSKLVRARKALAAVGMVLAFATMYYTGILVGVAESRPLWSQAAIPVLFTISGASAGIAMLLMPSALSKKEVGDEEVHGLERTDALLIGAEVFVIASIVFVLANSTSAAALSVQTLLTGDLSLLFWAGLVGVGLALPLLLYAGTWTFRKHKAPTWVAFLASFSVLVGGLTLRYVVLGAGQSYEMTQGLGFTVAGIAIYVPTMTEITLAAGLFLVFAVAYALGARMLLRK